MDVGVTATLVAEVPQVLGNNLSARLLTTHFICISAAWQELTTSSCLSGGQGALLKIWW